MTALEVLAEHMTPEQVAILTGAAEHLAPIVDKVNEICSLADDAVVAFHRMKDTIYNRDGDLSDEMREFLEKLSGYGPFEDALHQLHEAWFCVDRTHVRDGEVVRI